ncbi:uncharacterized protein N7483_009505 [Penicillium malachiteum]|uniref:uncharacterized protein n=1 Tax=Penicillium malachiteum TaxID=1324776 RepID=UPI002546D4C8|nr:uncharacterized protein N7483_009505 [Penicillium malachiteum]KAJ5721571.1 hypothetical protein N7483_009505 [Penicillium malachiteum]
MSFLRRVIPARVANNGSQQRDHHANERTFLSWTRAGLGFAAMALALDRLDAIDKVLCSKFGLGPLGPSIQDQNLNQIQIQNQNQSQDNADRDSSTLANAIPSVQTLPGPLAHAFPASRLCQVLGVWCLGYGFFRYWSMRRYLLVGQFVPAFWGPVFMTCGSFGAFMALGLQVDRKAFLVNI